MKAITLWEPYASLMAIGAKRNETRGRRTSLRGDVAIHASAADHGMPEEIVPLVIEAFQSRGVKPSPDTMGCIVAVVELYDCLMSEWFYEQREPNNPMLIELSKEEFAFGNYEPGRFIYMTRNVRRLKHPVPCRGAQAIGWTVPSDIEAKVRAEL